MNDAADVQQLTNREYLEPGQGIAAGLDFSEYQMTSQTDRTAQGADDLDHWLPPGQRIIKEGMETTSVPPQWVMRFLPGVGTEALSTNEAGAEADEDESQSEGLPSHSLLVDLNPDDLISLYFKEAAEVPLLTVGDEQRLARQIERGKNAREQLLEGAPPEAVGRLLSLIQQEQDALEKLILSNTRLVISIAKRYKGGGLPFLDLIQAGNIGLLRAVKKFDYRRGFKFSTFATWWIRQAITRELSDHSRTIRVPVHMVDQITKMGRETQRLQQQFNRKPTNAELASRMGISRKRLRLMQRAARNPISLEMPLSHEEDSMFGDFIEDQEAPDPEETASRNILQEQVNKLLDETLPPREARILRMRFGIGSGHRMSLREVGDKVGVSRERIRQLEVQAMRRLRKLQPRLKLRGLLESFG